MILQNCTFAYLNGVHGHLNTRLVADAELVDLLELIILLSVVVSLLYPQQAINCHFSILLAHQPWIFCTTTTHANYQESNTPPPLSSKSSIFSLFIAHCITDLCFSSGEGCCMVFELRDGCCIPP